MSERVAKMLRRLNQDSKKGKRRYNMFTWVQKSLVRTDYVERGDEARIIHTKLKKERKREQISNSKTT